MNILKRLMNVITLFWILVFALNLALWIYAGPPLNLWINSFTDRLINEPFPYFPIFFGWLIILFINYILFHKVTLWNKT